MWALGMPYGYLMYPNYWDSKQTRRGTQGGGAHTRDGKVS